MGVSFIIGIIGGMLFGTALGQIFVWGILEKDWEDWKIFAGLGIGGFLLCVLAAFLNVVGGI